MRLHGSATWLCAAHVEARVCRGVLRGEGKDRNVSSDHGVSGGGGNHREAMGRKDTAVQVKCRLPPQRVTPAEWKWRPRRPGRRGGGARGCATRGARRRRRRPLRRG